MRRAAKAAPRESASPYPVSGAAVRGAPTTRAPGGPDRSCRPAARGAELHCDSKPLPRPQVVVKLRFWCAGLRVPVVLPCSGGRHGQQYAFGAPARLQAEQGPAIVYQVEFHVPPAPIGLEFALSFGIGRVFTAFHDRQVGRQEALSHRARQGEGWLESTFVQIIEEEPAHASRFATVFQVEVFVAGLLVGRVLLRAEG